MMIYYLLELTSSERAGYYCTSSATKLTFVAAFIINVDGLSAVFINIS